jgi:hypothetical protein
VTARELPSGLWVAEEKAAEPTPPSPPVPPPTPLQLATRDAIYRSGGARLTLGCLFGRCHSCDAVFDKGEHEYDGAVWATLPDGTRHVSLVCKACEKYEAKECERCGKSEDGLDEFSGWKHLPGEGELLCPDCHATARMEE